MEKVYLDNAATTRMRPEVIAEMTNVMAITFGNPSSSHSFGRNARNVIELARKNIATLLGASASELIFTSGGTESDNWLVRKSVESLKLRRIVSARTEHDAILETINEIVSGDDVAVHFLQVGPDGRISLDELKQVLSDGIPTLVTLMHVNNETGVTLDLVKVGAICREFGAIFHTDAVQSVGKVRLHLHELPVDLLSASAHKFHGPKGVGLAYVRKGVMIEPLLTGGGQEKGLRAGTEQVAGIAGMSVALSIAMANIDIETAAVSALKAYLLKQLEIHFDGFQVNGGFQTFYTIANVMLPIAPQKASMIPFHLDMKGIAVSRGSACQSGSAKPSHVLEQMLNAEDLLKSSLRISFGHENTVADVDALISALASV